MNDLDDNLRAVVEPGVMRLKQQTRFKGLRLKGTESTTSSLVCRVGAKPADQLYGGGAGEPDRDIQPGVDR